MNGGSPPEGAEGPARAAPARRCLAKSTALPCRSAWASPGRPRQDRIPMEVEKPALSLGETAHVDHLPGLNAHPLQRSVMRDRRDYEITGVLETDESSVEQVVNAGRQQQTVLSVQAFLVRGIAPRLAMAG
jgi:hypothetical protein